MYVISSLLAAAATSGFFGFTLTLANGRFNVTLALPIVSNFPQKASLAAINASFVRSNDAVLYPTALKSAVLYTLLAAPLSGTYSAQNNAFDTSFCSSTEIVKDTLPSVTGLVT